MDETRTFANKSVIALAVVAAGADLFRAMAVYRDRLVHFYHDVSLDELFVKLAGSTGPVVTLM